MIENTLTELINRKQTLSKSLVVIMCGVAGSGKTTFAKQLEDAGFIRLSIDEEIWATYGKYGIDYSVEFYENYKEESEAQLHNQLIDLIQNKQHVVIDFSFWQSQRRDLYKKRIEDAGGEWELVYLKVSPEELRKRLDIRNQRFDANAAFPITDEILTTFLNGFEEPMDEGEMIIEMKS